MKTKKNNRVRNAVLTFYFPDDEGEFIAACKGMDMYCALYDMANELREARKYGPPIDPEKVEDRFHEILEEHKIHDIYEMLP